jgi:hypothetical protein
MERSVLLPSRRGVRRTAATVGIGLAAIPFALGILAGPSGAASLKPSTTTLQQLVEETECTVSYAVWEVANTVNGLLSPAPTPPPLCQPL